MSRRPGRAVIPFGKFKGCRLRNLPSDYLSFLTRLPMMRDDRWKWLKDSLYAELEFRGMNVVGSELEDADQSREVPVLRDTVRSISLHR